MNCLDAKTLILQIDNAFDDIDKIASKDIVLDSYLAKFLTVFISGIYEAAIEAIIKDMASRVGNVELENFVFNAVEKTFRNPDVSNIVGLLKKFNNSWGESISSLDSKYRTALDNIVNNKNNIAHGLPCSITLVEIKQYYDDSLKLIKEIDSLLA